MPRDDFSQGTKDTLARRVNYRCSQCGQETAGPHTDPSKAISIGVAAHITAAASDGPRYDSSLTPEQRKSSENGIWMCQNHGRLVDADEERYTVEDLRAMKKKAEAAALRALEAKVQELPPNVQAALQKAERLMPELLREMRNDLTEQPLARELVVLKKSWVYNGSGRTLAYYYETHSDLDQKMNVLENLHLIRDITRTNVKRYRVTEELADYLEATRGTATSAGPAQPADEWVEAIGVWRDPSTGLHLCPRCRTGDKRTPLKKEEHGYRCNACTGYFDDPTRPRRIYNPPVPRGRDDWMGN
jgi:hypothetical protein